MLDTLNTPPYLEETNPSRYKGMATAAVDIVQSIRKRWPDISIIANRGYAILPRLVDSIDAIIAESLLTTPNLAGTGFVLADGRSVELQMRLLEPARNRHPALPILTLDYWDLSDRDGDLQDLWPGARAGTSPLRGDTPPRSGRAQARVRSQPVTLRILDTKPGPVIAADPGRSFPGSRRGRAQAA